MNTTGIMGTDLPACFSSEEFVNDTCAGNGGAACEKCYFFNHYIVVIRIPIILEDVLMEDGTREE